MNRAALAPQIERVKQFDLTGIIQYQRDCIRQKKCLPFGRILNIGLGLDSAAAYNTGEAWKNISKLSKVMGLGLEWKQEEAPVAYWSEDRQSIVLPQGIPNLPTVAAQIYGPRIVRDPKDTRALPRIPQKLSDYASGRLAGRDSSGFLIIQPVLEIVVLTYGVSTMMKVKGFTQDNRWPFLLMSPTSPEAYIAGGILGFD